MKKCIKTFTFILGLVLSTQLYAKDCGCDCLGCDEFPWSVYYFADEDCCEEQTGVAMLSWYTDYGNGLEWSHDEYIDISYA